MTMNKILLLLLFVFEISISSAQSYNFEQGVKAYKDGNIDSAVEYFNREITDNPKAYYALYYRAYIFKYQENYSSALRDISNSIKYIPKKEKQLLSGAHSMRGDIYFEIDNIDKAFEEFNTALNINPDDADLYISRAQKYFELNKYNLAELDYRKALKMDETMEIAYAGLGRNYIAQFKYAEAETVLNKLIKLAPTYSDAFKFRARCFFEQNKFNEAIEDIFIAYSFDDENSFLRETLIIYSVKNTVLALSKVNSKIIENPERSNWYYVRSRINYDANYFNNSIKDINKLIEIEDEDYKPALIAYKGRCFKNLGMYEQSISAYSEVINLDSTDADNYNYRGDCKRLKGDYIGAVADFSKAITLDPTSAFYYYRRGWVHDEFMNNTTAGLNDYNQSIQLDRNYAYTYLHRGRLYEKKLNNRPKAIEDYTSILNIDTLISDGGNCKQYALFHLGRYNESMDWMKQILDKYPTDGNYYDAACLYSLLNKTDESLNYLKQAFEKGYVDLIHLGKDDDLDNCRKSAGYNALIEEWKKKIEENNKNEVEDQNEIRNMKEETVSVPMKVRGSNTYEVACKINGLGLNLIFDTGASDISISQTEVQFMLKNGYLTYNDITGTQKYMDANGDIEVGTTLIFKNVDFGGLVLKNVKASVVNNKNAPLLFGQSALSKYGKITIDNEKKLITITRKTSF
jgi:clan AA aspartic protease (TIGR02281 family)